MTLQEVKTWLLLASREDLSQVSEIIKVRRDQLAHLHALEFQSGDRVYFDAGNRGIIRGTFQNVARKNAIVKADSGMIWRVSPQLLHADSAPAVQPTNFTFVKR